MLDEFKKFALKGNVVDLAIGVIIGTAFGRIVTSLVQDIIMPPLGLLIGGMDFSDYFLNLSGKNFSSMAKAKEAGAAAIYYGVFITNLLNFLIVAWVIFLVVRQINRLRGEPATDAKPAARLCPYCTTSISAQAVRCPACTSDLEPAAGANPALTL